MHNDFIAKPYHTSQPEQIQTRHRHQFANGECRLRDEKKEGDAAAPPPPNLDSAQNRLDSEAG
jgi:hypothetical protein